MIHIDIGDKIYVLYCRTNRRTKWQYAEYGGRYETPDKAVEAAKEHYGDIPFEYRILTVDNAEVATGFMNWKGK